MARALVDERADASQVGEFFTEADDLGEENPFANLVSVTFSAFDPFEPLPTPQNKATEMQYAYVGLKRIRRTATDEPLAPMSHRRLAREFSDRVKVCLQGAGLGRWRRALKTLKADPIFLDSNIVALAAESDGD